jgi:hypothetical protein
LVSADLIHRKSSRDRGSVERRIGAGARCRTVVCVTQALNALSVLFIVRIFWISARASGARPGYVLAFPAAALLFAYIIWRASLIAVSRGSVTWRGTSSPLAQMRATACDRNCEKPRRSQSKLGVASCAFWMITKEIPCDSVSSPISVAEARMVRADYDFTGGTQ